MSGRLASKAAELIQPKLAVPIHWGTFDLLTGDPETFRSLVKRGEVLTPDPGETLQL